MAQHINIEVISLHKTSQCVKGHFKSLWYVYTCTVLASAEIADHEGCGNVGSERSFCDFVIEAEDNMSLLV